jgi:hypothetical protein
MDGFRIFFELRPLSDVQPWGDAESGLSLHWFGLTDGWYDVAIDEHRLYSGRGETRGIDYQVVRLWPKTEVPKTRCRKRKKLPQQLLRWWR